MLLHNRASIAAVILAAGASTRMGTPKQLLRYEGQSLLRRIAKTAIASQCDPVIVVLGANRDQLYRELSNLSVQIIENQDWKTGMGSSIRHGIQALIEASAVPEAVILLLCDQPFVSTQTIHQLKTVYRSNHQLIVAAAYQGIVGVPALFHAMLFSELASLTQAEGARTVIQRHSDSVVAVEFPQGAIDIDTPKDYQQYLSGNLE